MATIGTFTKSGDGFTGTLRTLTLDLEVSITPAEKGSGKAPEYRLYAGSYRCGVAWRRTSREGRAYLSVRLDDPSFPAAINASLFEAENETFALIWSRRSGD